MSTVFKLKASLWRENQNGSDLVSNVLVFLVRWLTQKGVRQKKLNEWLGIKNENTEE